MKQGRLSLKPELEQVVNISECLLPQARKHYEELFGAPVLDDYAMGECLFLSNGCPTSGGMHVNADWAILEVVDEENRQVAGRHQERKVLITNLANFAAADDSLRNRRSADDGRPSRAAAAARCR